MPAGGRQRVGGQRPRGRARALLRRRLLGSARLEGHLFKARLDGAPIRLRPGACARRRLYAPGGDQRPGRRRRARAGRAGGADEPRRSRRRGPECRLYRRRSDGRGRGRAFGRGGRLARALYPAHGRGRDSARRERGHTLPYKDVVREMVLLGHWRGEAATFPVPGGERAGLAEAAIVQGAGCGPVLAAARR